MEANYLDIFFLVIDEGEDIGHRENDLFEPRRCSIEDGVRVVGVPGAVVVRVEPPYGQSGIAIHEIVLAPALPSLPIRGVIAGQVPVDIYRIRSETEVPSRSVVINSLNDRIGAGTVTASFDEALSFTRELRPVFYLVLTRRGRAAGPWRCYTSRARTKRWCGRKVLVTVAPGIPGELLGQRHEVINNVLLARESPNASILPIEETPVQVLVYQVLVDVPDLRESLIPDDLQSIGDGELYDNETSAWGRVRDLNS